MNLRTRFDDKWTPEPYSSCWIWIGAQDKKGYGRISVGGRLGNARVAHRVSWQLNRGDIPIGMDVCHSCDTPSCVNPDHLFIGTRLDNMQDAVKKGRTTVGERNPQSKLTKENVVEIRSSTETQEVLGKRYGVMQSAISRIKTGKRWTHLEL